MPVWWRKRRKWMRKWERGEAENKRGQTKAEKIHQGRRNWLVSVCLFVCLLRGEALVQMITHCYISSFLFWSKPQVSDLLDFKKGWMHTHMHTHTCAHAHTKAWQHRPIILEFGSKGRQKDQGLILISMENWRSTWGTWTLSRERKRSRKDMRTGVLAHD